VSGDDRLLVLTYHAIDDEPSVISMPPALFRRQMDTLAALGLRGIGLVEAFRHREETGRFPDQSVALTFDDGYLTVLRHALPALQSHGFGATAFVVSGAVGMGRRQAAAINRDLDRDLMDWKHLAELAACGVEIGSHTQTHADLRRVGPDALRRELSVSRETLQQRLQLPVESFAYPYGRFDRNVRDAAAGQYWLACTTRLGRHTAGDDPLQIRRVDAWYLRRHARFERLAGGGLDAWLALRQAARDIRQAFRR